MYNELFSIGPLTVYGYGLCIGLGVIAALLISWRRAGNRGLNTDIPTELAMLAVICGFAGAKVLYILTSMDEFMADPMSVLGFEGFVVYKFFPYTFFYFCIINIFINAIKVAKILQK